MKENTNAPIYTLTGIVIHGRGIGKHVGTPTANMEIAKNTFLPKTGVYVADILLSDKRYYGVTHIGARPTLEYSARDCAPQPLKLSIHSGGIEHPCRCR